MVKCDLSHVIAVHRLYEYKIDWKWHLLWKEYNGKQNEQQRQKAAAAAVIVIAWNDTIVRTYNC